jgi:hypothetical protein
MAKVDGAVRPRSADAVYVLSRRARAAGLADAADVRLLRQRLGTGSMSPSGKASTSSLRSATCSIDL